MLTRRQPAAPPHRRRPKELTTTPVLFARSSGGDLPPASGRRDPGGSRRPSPTGGSAPGDTDEEGGVVRREALESVPADPATRALARRVAAGLLVPRPPRTAAARRGVGELLSLPYQDGAGADLDLDRTLERLVGQPFPEPEDVVVRDRIRQRRSVALLVDVSGSMRGERVKTAAATLAALATELRRDRLAVVAFWSDAAVLLELGEAYQPLTLLDALLALPARGLTNVAFPLEVAAAQLAHSTDLDTRVVLLSDCVHNAGPDPRRPAAALPRLDVLLDVSGEKDVELGRDLARAGRGRLELLHTYRDVVPALGRVFGG